MTDKKEVEIIADIYEQVMNLGKYYIKQLDAEKTDEVYEVNGAKLNSARWLVGHLIWAENGLMLASSGGPVIKHDWLNQFGFGVDGSIPPEAPDFIDLYRLLKTTNEGTLAHLRSLDDAVLEEEVGNPLFGFLKINRNMFYHAIRHQAQHVGHISWIVKIQGKPTI